MRIKLGLSLCFLLVVHSAQPLWSHAPAAPDICCQAQADCPGGSRCATDVSPCSGEREGYCVPINAAQ